MLNFVNRTTPLAGINVALSGTSKSTITNAEGKFSFDKVPQGNYTLQLTHPDFLDRSVAVAVVAGQITDVSAEMNPAVIRSTVANTGWFSYNFPYESDANGRYAEVAMETPVVIDFASLNFVKAEVTYSGEYNGYGTTGTFYTYLSVVKQLTVLQDLGTWWVGNSASVGSFLGEYRSTSPATTYTVDITEFVRNNPNAMYFLAARNNSTYNMRLTGIQMSIFYR